MVTQVFASPVARGRSDLRAGAYTQQPEVGPYAYASMLDGVPRFTSARATEAPPHPPPKSLGQVPMSPMLSSAWLLLNVLPIA